ncbi:hypothetical protein BgramDRAFT_5089 [Paraburkholderia graminis C4D1M]|uniref:Uncharacterized protein n=1 Tax=Paraburkholderia graminis (strain ATCC 700544 / DSM 17151 / LMG 18924 / NCIMB 13744 / C4D1M) TaxID=396598 RepID=B1G6U3_PARG4|nr:hypothetical protein BgramDRAFT_5089 [Paraburkholderia graminis C4D1M]
MWFQVAPARVPCSPAAENESMATHGDALPGHCRFDHDVVVVQLHALRQVHAILRIAPCSTPGIPARSAANTYAMHRVADSSHSRNACHHRLSRHRASATRCQYLLRDDDQARSGRRYADNDVGRTVHGDNIGVGGIGTGPGENLRQPVTYPGRNPRSGRSQRLAHGIRIVVAAIRGS